MKKIRIEICLDDYTWKLATKVWSEAEIRMILSEGGIGELQQLIEGYEEGEGV